MADDKLLGTWLRRFLLEYLVLERNLSKNTQRSYRDTFRLLIPFASKRTKKNPDILAIDDISPELLRQFLLDLENTRHCCVSTRNQRLAALHSLAGFIGLQSPETLSWCSQVRSIPLKRAPRPSISYLEKPEMDAILNSPDQATLQGRRDHALLLFLYNSGACADEAAQARIEDLSIARAKGRDQSFILIRGKGNKLRRCPLWVSTVGELAPLIALRAPAEPVFLNRCGQPITRFGIHTLVERHAARASAKEPTLAGRKISPHTIRHTTATHLLRAGVDINTIRAWLGHVSLNTTNVYAEVDLEMKAKALAKCDVKVSKGLKKWRDDPSLLEFLRAL